MGPLHGLKVIEMAGTAPGPFAAMMLADMGAEVLCIERPLAPGAQWPEPKTQLLRRNRRSISLDLKNPQAAAIVLRLISRADALIEGFRPGVMERFGFGPDIARQINPRLVYGRMTGWGQSGPMAHAAGHDLNYIALAGALHAIGAEGMPPAIPLNLVGDFGGGGMYLAFGIVCALLESRQSGQGQVVDAAMVDGAASLMTYIFAAQSAGRWSGQRGGDVLSGAAPWYGVYETSDGHYVTVAAVEPNFYEELLRRLGLENEPLPARDDRSGWPTLRAKFANVFREKTRAQWCEVLEKGDACFAPVLSLSEAPAHKHFVERGTFVDVDGVVQPAPAPRFSRTSADHPNAWQPPGVDDAMTLEAWGFTENEIRSLKSTGAFGAVQ